MGTWGITRTFLTITEIDVTLLMPRNEKKNGGNYTSCDVERGKVWKTVQITLQKKDERKGEGNR